MSFSKEYLLSIPSKKPILQRLHEKSYFNENGCQIYTGALDRCGYGKIKVGNRNLGAHKVMYILSIGDFDQDKYEMLHLCHNPRCINPEHIEVGTHQRNMEQASNRGTLGRPCRKLYSLCAEGKNYCLIFKSTYEAESLGYKSAHICTSMKRNGMYRGFYWKYVS
ncbi:hypothetical protein ZP9_00032 [Shewanella phage ZP9]|nr:hypothetical protein ZP9_00032 [Shewanella phage ZP9]